MIDTSKDMRWMANNFLESGYGSFNVSSEHPDFPKANMLDGSHRTKVFKFGGRFLIEEDVNDIVYFHQSGSNLSIQVTPGDYSGAELATEITAIFLASGWTELVVTYDSDTRLFTFTEDETFKLRFQLTTNAIWETLGFSLTVETTAIDENPVYYLVSDEQRIHWPYEEISIDFGYQAQIGFIAMIGDLAQEMKIPEGAEITILGNTVDSFTAPPLSQTIPWYTTGCFKFLDDIEDSAWRYIKIRIACPSGPFVPEIGYLYVGDYERSGTRNIGTGFELNYEDPSEISSADAGHIYGNTRTPMRVYSSMTIGLAKKEQAAFLKNKYAQKQKIVPFFVALDPTSYLSTSFDEHLAFVRFTEPPRYKHVLRDMFELSFTLKEAL